MLGRGDRILAWQWYWVDGIFTGSDTRAKVHQLLARLQGRDDFSAWIAIYSRADATPDAAAKGLAQFVREMGDSLERALIMSTQR